MARQADITGTNAAPAISGQLEQNPRHCRFARQVFTLTRGMITFDGSAKFDAFLNIVAEASAADIAAQVNIGGSAFAPWPDVARTACRLT
jgi:translocation and assembly module TamB